MPERRIRANDAPSTLAIALFEDFEEIVVGGGVEGLQLSRISRSLCMRLRKKRGCRPLLALKQSILRVASDAAER